MDESDDGVSPPRALTRTAAGTLWSVLPEPSRQDVLRTLSMLVDRAMTSGEAALSSARTRSGGECGAVA